MWSVLGAIALLCHDLLLYCDLLMGAFLLFASKRVVVWLLHIPKRCPFVIMLCQVIIRDQCKKGASKRLGLISQVSANLLYFVVQAGCHVKN